MKGGMKRGKSIKSNGWKGLIDSYADIPPLPVKGYSTAEEVSRVLKVANCTASRKLQRMRERGQIEAKKARSSTGKVVWVYKD